MRLDQPQAIRTLFFDVGGTLLSAFPSDLEICRQVCVRMGLSLRQEDLESRVEEAEAFFRHHMRADPHIWASEKSLRAFWIKYYLQMLRPLAQAYGEERLHKLAHTITEEYDLHTSWQIYPDVLPTLQKLRASGKYTLGAISDWSPALGSIFQRLKLTLYFDCLLVSSVHRHSKPASALYEAALARANEIGDYAMHIGDSYPLDVLGARSVGMTPVLLDRRHQVTQEQVDCLLIHSLSELMSLLEIAD